MLLFAIGTEWSYIVRITKKLHVISSRECPLEFIMWYLRIITTVLLFGISAPATAQEGAEDESTVTYPASFFAQYGPVSVNDMLNVIPGIIVALEGNEVQSFNGADRGL